MKELMEFKIRAYGKTELALLYMPNSAPRCACKNLQRWININPELTEELCRAGYLKQQRILTPRQVKIIVKYIGEP